MISEAISFFFFFFLNYLLLIEIREFALVAITDSVEVAQCEIHFILGVKFGSVTSLFSIPHAKYVFWTLVPFL